MSQTVKGKGFAPAEKEPTIWHAPGCFNPETGDRITAKEEQKPPKFQDVFGLTLVELAKKNDKITVITPAMPTGSSTCFMMGRNFPKGLSMSVSPKNMPSPLPLVWPKKDYNHFAVSIRLFSKEDSTKSFTMSPYKTYR